MQPCNALPSRWEGQLQPCNALLLHFEANCSRATRQLRVGKAFAAVQRPHFTLGRAIAILQRPSFALGSQLQYCNALTSRWRSRHHLLSPRPSVGEGFCGRATRFFREFRVAKPAAGVSQPRNAPRLLLPLFVIIFIAATRKWQRCIEIVISRE